MRLALWFGIAAGVVEVVLLAVIKFGSLASAPAGWANPDDRLRHSYLWLSPHVVWMAPAMLSVFLLVPAGLLALVARFREEAKSLSLASGVAAFVCCVSLLYIYPRLHDVAVLMLAGGVAVQVARFAGARRTRF